MNIFLSFFSIAHCFGAQIKNKLYQQKIFKPKRAPLPVISVGNITFGGTEKTPLVMNLISFLLKEGYKPALISRGYKGKWENKGGILSDGNKISGTWKESGDEPYMVALNFPEAGIFCGKQRLHSCQKAERLGFDLAILDDGFQHLRLHRDLDIVLYDPGKRAPLREFTTSLKRAQIILAKKNNKNPEGKKVLKTTPPQFMFEYSVVNLGFHRVFKEDILPPDSFKGKKALVFCGIARPERFLTLLTMAGIDVVFFLPFPDHHSYPSFSIKKISTKFHELKPDNIITTEKDSVKLLPLNPHLKELPLYFMKIDLEINKKIYEIVKLSIIEHAK